MKHFPRALCVLFAFLSVSLAGTASRPNIIVILSDDMGFSDLGCYGGEIGTPNLDGLAANGIRFTQFYNTARCCPTRASLLTGLYPHQAAVGHMTEEKGLDGYHGDLSHNAVTIAEVMKSAGYGTYAVGKWHVTRNDGPDSPKDNWPLQRGFDRYYGTIRGAGSYYDPGTLTRDNTMISPFADPEYKPSSFYYTDAISDHAIRFIREHCQNHAQQPFFMYTAYTCAHWPMHAPAEEVAKQHGKYDSGYEAIRQARFAQARRLGVINPGWQISPIVGEWPGVQNKAWEARCMEVYAAMIRRMDRGIGRIVEELKQQKILNDTLILFMQDNGACQEPVGRRTNKARPATPSLPPIAADAVRVEVRPKQNRRGVPTLEGPSNMPGSEDTYIAYGENWANVSNTPFRYYKHFVHEGGISTPLIAHWPAGISRHGELEKQPGHLIDIMTTCVDVSGATYPAEFHGKRITPMEGRSLVPAFDGKTIQREAIFWEHEGNRALREGNWKLVAKSPHGQWELYDMEADRTEMHDLASVELARVRDMAQKWEAWAARTHALPWPWKPAYGKSATAAGGSSRIDLQQGADLSKENAPRVSGRPFVIHASLATVADGVIVAQGGETHGYSLYVKDGKLKFAMRHKNKLTLVEAPEKLGGGAVEVEVALSKDGLISIKVGNETAATGKTSGPLTQTPADGLQVGRDANKPVGPYASPFAFGGKIVHVSIELGGD